MGNTSGIKIREKGGNPLKLGNLEVVPYHRAVTVLGTRFGWVWNRPSHLVVDQAGELRRIPIPDRTRQIQFLLWTAGLVFLLAGLIMSRNQKEQ